MTSCPKCGKEVSNEVAFCPSCGYNLKAHQAPIASPGAPPPSSGAHPGASTNAGKAGVSQAVKMREKSDRVMSVAWIFLPLVGVAFGIGGFASFYVFGLGGIFVMLGLMVVEIVLIAAFWYFLISRRNDHFRRDKVLRSALVEYIRQEGEATGRSSQLSTEIATMNSINGEASADETEKSAVLWIILSIVTFGLLGLYVLYFLTKDPYKHDSRQQGFMQQAQSALVKLGKTVVNPSWKALPSRSFFLYFVLSIITFGLFEYYWYYTLIVDFNNHFKAQWQLEDSIMAAI
ncbi:MAG: DUF4234 domain-containing protein [Nitrososphaerota archaeon]|nr:DUF4234 domain-containing protein [Nitrososphaerota archaeon]